MTNEKSPWFSETTENRLPPEREIRRIVLDEIIEKKRNAIASFQDMSRVLERRFNVVIEPQRLFGIIRDMRRPLYAAHMEIRRTLGGDGGEVMAAPGWVIRKENEEFLKDSFMIKFQNEGGMGANPCPVELDEFDIELFRPERQKHLPSVCRMPASQDRLLDDRVLLTLTDLMTERFRNGSLLVPCMNNDCGEDDEAIRLTCLNNRTVDTATLMNDSMIMLKGLCDGSHPYSLYLVKRMGERADDRYLDYARLAREWEECAVVDRNRELSLEEFRLNIEVFSRLITGFDWARLRMLRLLKANWPDQKELRRAGIELPPYAEMEKEYRKGMA